MVRHQVLLLRLSQGHVWGERWRVMVTREREVKVYSILITLGQEDSQVLVKVTYLV